MTLSYTKYYRIKLFVLSLIITILVIGSVWAPIIMRFYVHATGIGDNSINKLKLIPKNDVLDEVNQFSYGIEQPGSDTNIVAAATKIIEEGKFSEFPEAIKGLSQFKKELLSEGLPREQLLYSSLIVPKILLEAYLISKNEEFYSVAHKFIIDWARYEQSVWLPDGFLWDDHAIAARVLVLSKFWAIYRQHKSFTNQDASILIHSVERSAEILSKKGLFSVGTNHGVMQNIALLHIALVFPELKNTASYIKLAVQRLSEQIAFYINDEGVVQEHSAEYHEYGLQLLSMAFRYMELLNIEIPEKWYAKYNHAVNVYRNLLRPDGTLPMYGDTDGAKRKAIYLSEVDNIRYYRYLLPLSIVKQRDSFTMLPKSGYSIWWDGKEGACDQSSQTLVAWPNFVSHAHKHADETSLLFWSNGQSWWTDIGYWPYGINYREQAVSWQGSNAMHYINEPATSNRTTILKSYFNSCDVKYLELERVTDDGYHVNRQVLKYQNTWLVLDHVSDINNRTSRIIWTTLPDVSVKHEGGQNYLLGRSDEDGGLSVVFSDSTGFNTKLHRGDTDPFSGWLAQEDGIAETNAFVLDLLPEKWSAIAWRPVSDYRKQGLSSVDIISSASVHEWTIRIAAAETTLMITRVGPDNKLIISGPDGKNPQRIVLLRDAPELTDTSIDQQYVELRNKYDQGKIYYIYRIRVTWYLVTLFFLQELLFLIITSRVSLRNLLVSRNVMNTGWLVMAGWLHFFYFS